MGQVKFWIVGEHKGKKSKIGLDIPLQEHNCFVNGFLERLQEARAYQNEPRIMRNEPW